MERGYRALPAQIHRKSSSKLSVRACDATDSRILEISIYRTPWS